MNESPNLAKKILRKVKSSLPASPLYVLPYMAKMGKAAVMDVMDKCRGDIKGTLERVDDSNHEMAHAAFAMLGGSKIKKISRSALPVHLKSVLGKFFNGGSVESVVSEDDEKFSNKMIINHALTGLSGATYQFSQNFTELDSVKSVKEKLGNAGGGSDYDIVKQLLTDSNKCNGREDSLIDNFFEELMSFFKNPEVAKMMNVLSNKLIKDRKIEKKGGGVEDVLRKLLVAEGVNMTVIEQEYKNLTLKCTKILG